MSTDLVQLDTEPKPHPYIYIYIYRAHIYKYGNLANLAVRMLETIDILVLTFNL